MPKSYQEAFNKLSESRGFPPIYPKKKIYTKKDMIAFADYVQPKYPITEVSLKEFLNKKK